MFVTEVDNVDTDTARVKLKKVTFRILVEKLMGSGDSDRSNVLIRNMLAQDWKCFIGRRRSGYLVQKYDIEVILR